jgi:uncharacterized protein (DUF2267 family)
MPGISGPYSVWVTWLSAFGRGEDPPVEHLPVIDERYGPAMLERLMQHVAAAFDARQKRWQEALRRDQDLLLVETGNAVTAMAVVLVDARARLAPLVALTRTAALPEPVRDTLRDALEKTVRSSQQTLDDSSRDGPAELRNTIRANTLLAGLRHRPASQQGAPTTTRRVILG